MIKTTSLIPVLALLLFAVQAQDANIAADPNRMKAVSYTHLTLPTKA